MAFHWETDARGDFATSSNWTPTGFPSAAADALFDAAGNAYEVTGSSSKVIGTLTRMDLLSAGDVELSHRRVTLMAGPSSTTSFSR